MNYEICGGAFQLSDAAAADAEDDTPVAQLKKRKRKQIGDEEDRERPGGGWKYTPQCIGGGPGDHKVRPFFGTPLLRSRVSLTTLERRFFPLISTQHVHHPHDPRRRAR